MINILAAATIQQHRHKIIESSLCFNGRRMWK